MLTSVAVVLGCVAFAGEPETVVHEDGTVVISVSVDADQDEIRRVIAEEIDGLSTDSRVVKTVSRGECSEIDRETRGIFRPFRFKALRCPTENGFQETLVEVGDFSSYVSSWEVAESSDGTRIVYSVRTELNHPVPNTVVRQGVIAGAKNAVTNLVNRVLGKNR